MSGRCNFARVLAAAVLLAMVIALLLSPAAASAQSSTVPSRPTGVTDTPGHRTFTLHWTAPANDGGSPITGYEVKVSSRIYATGSTSTSYVVDVVGDFPGGSAVWSVLVRAVNANGNGEWSDFWAVEVRPATVTIAGEGDSHAGDGAGSEWRWVDFTLTADRPVLSASWPLNVSVLVSETNQMIPDGYEGTNTASFALNSATHVLQLSPTTDTTQESDSVVTATIQTSTDYTVGTPSSDTVTILDDDGPPERPITGFTVTEEHYSLNAEWDAYVPGPGEPTSVDYQIQFGTGDDAIKYPEVPAYRYISGSLGNYDVRVRAVNAANPDRLGLWSDPVPVRNGGATVAIAGNDPVSEGGDAVFTLTTDRANVHGANAKSVLIVDVLVSETDDMVASANEKVHTVTFPYGPGVATTVTLTVPTMDDERDERDSVVTATIQTAPSIQTRPYTVGSPASAGVKVTNDDFGNFERRRLDSCGVSAPHSSGHGIECFQLVGSSHVRTPEEMAERGYAPVGIKQPEVGDIVAMEGLPDDWVINVLGAKVDAAVVTVAAGTSPVTEGTNVMFTVTRATAATTHLSVTVGVAETQSMIFNGVPDSINSQWPTRVDILANATDATFLVVTDDDDVDEADSVITASVTVEDNDGTAQQQQAEALGAPTIFIATAKGPAQVDLIWTTPEFGIATGYGIQWSTDGKTGWQAVEPPDDGGDTMYRHVGLTPETTYYYRMRYLTEDGPDEWTYPVAATTATDAWQPTIAAVSETQVDLSWTAPEEEFTGYYVEWSADGRTGWTATDPLHSGTAASYSHNGLTEGTTYYYRVLAVNGNIPGAWSPVVSATTMMKPNTPATGVPTIGGTAQVGETLTADTSDIADADGLAKATFSYQWQAGGADISGATGSTYTLADADEGAAISVTVTFTDDSGNAETLTSAATATVQSAEAPTSKEARAANNPATGVPTITGTAQVGETLTADTSGIADADGLAKAVFSHQWQADGADIAGATGATYTLTSDDVGAAISVTVTFTETSAATDAVEARPNTPATGEPTINGTAQVGETLTANTSGIADEDGLTNAVFSYQWQADGSNISGATGSTYTLSDADEGKAVSVKVSFTDDAGNAETLTSAATTAVKAKPNSSATGAPTISGPARVGETLTADTSGIADEDGLSDATFAYQWLGDGADMSGATGSTYTLLDPDEGKTISVTVSFTDDAGNGEELTSAATDVVEAKPNNPATGAPAIRGTAQVGETLTSDTSGISDADGLANASFSYQWRADGADISGATDATYALADSDEGKTVKVRVSFTDDAGNDETLTSAATQAAMAAREWTENWASGREPTNLRGEATDRGIVMTWDAPQDAADEVTGYQVLRWRPQLDEARGIRVYVDDTGSAATTYTDADTVDGEHHSYQVRAIRGNELSAHSNYLDLRGKEVTVVPNSSATGAPAITGTARVGETLTADVSGIADEDGLTNAAYRYQWLADGADILGTTGSTYTLVGSDQGKAISVRVSFADDGGNDETLTSAATNAVDAKPNTPATGLPVISGTAQVGETLTADTSGIADEDGLGNAALAYQWQADDAEISGATDETYTLADADEGRAVSVKVSFTDDAGNAETLTSVATGAVAAKANSPATGAPAISGTAQVGETLTADTSGIADDDGLNNVVYAYQWLADGADLSGSTGSTYTLADADIGKAISVKVSFTDDRGHQEELTSAATDAVAGLPPPPLTASLENVATSHDGESAFTFELRFSEEFAVSYRTLRDHAFTVTGGAVRKAGRLEPGSNIAWRITVQSSGNADVSIGLPITTDCNDDGAMCTDDGRRLSTELELTVSGPGQ